jgi:hypothetical protein
MNERKRRRPELDDDDLDEAPVRKKKKKKKKPSPWLKIGLMGGGGLVVLIIVIWAIVTLTRGAPPAQTVTAFERFVSDEGEFGFDYPRGWHSKAYGLRDTREVDVKGPAASINVKENLVGSLIADISRAAAGGKPVPEELEAFSQAHEMRKPKDTRSYQEEPPVTVMTKGFGKARRSAYKDGSKRGYRATILMHQTALDVYCECRASDWETLRPAFERVIESLGPGG